MSISSIENFRGLGGLKTTSGRAVKPLLFRSGHLYEVTEGDAEKLIALNISHVVDYRSDAELDFRPVRFPDQWQPNYTSAAIGGNASAWIKDLIDRFTFHKTPSEDLEKEFMKAYRDIPLKNIAGIKLLFDKLLAAEEGEATLFHCTAGKDRTGITAAFVLKILGVHDDDIMANYLETNTAVDLEAKADYLARSIAKRTGRPVNPKDIWPLVGVNEGYLNHSYETITTEFGSLDGYFETALGLTDTKRAALRARYLK